MDWTKQIGRYAIVMMLQVLLFNQLQLFGVCHPYIYVMCLLMMPITLPHSVDMVIGAVVGLIMDVFCNSLGIHMSACILLMFLRPYILGVIINDKERLTEQINQQTIGLVPLLKYAAILVAVHHLLVFALGAWSWYHIGFILIETLVSSVLTLVVLLGYNALRYR